MGKATLVSSTYRNFEVMFVERRASSLYIEKQPKA